jgi:hypothetical protein
MTAFWIRTKVRAPRADDSVNGDVWTWTDPKGDTPQTHDYNARTWEEVAQYPDVYPLWMPIIPVKPSDLA